MLVSVFAATVERGTPTNAYRDVRITNTISFEFSPESITTSSRRY